MFIFPIGHERDTVRRLPWVTFALMGACLLSFVITWCRAPAWDGTAERDLRSARDYFLRNAWTRLEARAEALLFSALRPDRRSQLIALYRGGAKAPSNPAERKSGQAEMDRLAALALASDDQLPFERWGLQPGAPTPSRLLTHLFLHREPLTLLGCLLILYLTGPYLEDVWGRPMFAAFFLGSGVVAALAILMASPASAEPIVGASGAIAGLMGAFLVRYWNTEIEFFYLLTPSVQGTFSCPAWRMLPVWFIKEILRAWTGAAGLVLDRAAGWGRVAGFTFGAAVAFVVARRRESVTLSLHRADRPETPAQNPTAIPKFRPENAKNPSTR